MKKNKLYLIISIYLLASSFGCSEKDEEKSPFSNVIYISTAINKNTDNLLLKNKDSEIIKEIQATLAYPENKEIKVKYKIDPSLVNAYKLANGIECEALPTNHYSFAETNAVVPAGGVLSSKVELTFTSLKEVPNGKVYLLPVTIESSDMGILNGSRTIYYLIRKSAPITTVANIEKNYLSVPGFATGSGSVVNGLTQLTMEALIRVHDFDSNGKIISSVMGVEGYFLIRLGDAGFYQDQIQFAGNPQNFPNRNADKRLKKSEWQHVALTYDKASENMCIYVNGVLQSEGSVYYSSAKISLGRSDFFIGRSYDDERDMRGEISECRIWSVVRTQEEIADNMYEVDTQSSGLAAYWKFDEGEGTQKIIKDHSGNGNDAEAKNPLKWISVSLPENQ